MINKLAAAFEQQLLTRGDSVRLVAGEGGEEEGEGVGIKLVVTGRSNKSTSVNLGQVQYSLARTM